MLIGEKKAVFYAIRNETTAGRNTKLAKRLMPESEESKAVAAALAKKLIQGEELKELNIKSSVYLVKRDSVRE